MCAKCFDGLWRENFEFMPRFESSPLSRLKGDWRKALELVCGPPSVSASSLLDELGDMGMLAQAFIHRVTRKNSTSSEISMDLDDLLDPLSASISFPFTGFTSAAVAGTRRAFESKADTRDNKETKEATSESHQESTAKKKKTKNTNNTRVCSGCGQDEKKCKGKKLRVCARCKIALYCCRECQRCDWNRGHKQTCAPVK